MNKKTAIPALCFFLIFGTALFSLNLKRANANRSVTGKTLVLYDADLGTIPSAPLMNFAGFPTGAAAPTYENRVTVLDTTTSGNSTFAGWMPDHYAAVRRYTKTADESILVCCFDFLSTFTSPNFSTPYGECPHCGNNSPLFGYSKAQWP